MIGCVRALMFCVAALVLASTAIAADIAPDDVKFEDLSVKQFLTGKPGDPGFGKKWAVTRKAGNCLACHAAKALSDFPYHGELGPALDGVASRYTPAQIRAIIIYPKQVLGEQPMMPAFYRVSGLNRVGKKFVGKPVLTAQQVEGVVAFLTTLKDE